MIHEPDRSRSYLIGGVLSCLIVLVLGVVGLLRPFDPLGIAAAFLIVVVGASGLFELGLIWRRNRKSG